MKIDNPENPLERNDFSMDDFHHYLREFDKAVCEANAVSQGLVCEWLRLLKGGLHTFFHESAFMLQ